MATRVRDLLMGQLGELRYEPIEKRIRGMLGDRAVVDSQRAMLVWEPKRIVPSYAVPVEDIAAELVVAQPSSGGGEPEDRGERTDAPQLGDRTVYDPSIPFSVHTADGEPLGVRAGDVDRPGAAFRLRDAGLAGYVVLDFPSFDAWYEEDELNLAHPRDPFHRIDIVHSSRRVVVERDDQVLAESTTPYVLFEPPLPVRYYLPREDVLPDVLRPSATRTFCAYKGQASYFSLADQDDVAWTYVEPLREASEVTGRIAFFNERVDLRVDGVRLERPVTPWSRRWTAERKDVRGQADGETPTEPDVPA
jgi:uncharacterized protein (DUF427 family)